MVTSPLSLDKEREAKVKGSALVGIVKALRHAKEKGRQATPESVHHLLDSRILSTSWHDLDDYLSLLGALASIIEVPQDMDPWEFIGKFGAANYREGVYRNLFRQGDPTSTLKNYSILWKLRYDRGRVVVEVKSPTQAQVEVRDAGIISENFCKATRGLIVGLLEEGGASDIELHKIQCRTRGDSFCAWQVQWANPD